MHENSRADDVQLPANSRAGDTWKTRKTGLRVTVFDLLTQIRRSTLLGLISPSRVCARNCLPKIKSNTMEYQSTINDICVWVEGDGI